MKCERIGLRFGKKDEDIISWFLMLKENGIEQSFAVKALLKAFFMHEYINAGTVRIRHQVYMEPTSIAINEIELNSDINNIKNQGIKLAAFTRDIIRSYINIGENDSAPQIVALQKIHSKYKLKYLNKIFSNEIEKDEVKKTDENNDIKFMDNNNDSIIAENIKIMNNKNSEADINHLYIDKDQTSAIEDDQKETYKKTGTKKKNPLLAQI